MVSAIETYTTISCCLRLRHVTIRPKSASRKMGMGIYWIINHMICDESRSENTLNGRGFSAGKGVHIITTCWPSLHAMDPHCRLLPVRTHLLPILPSSPLT